MDFFLIFDNIDLQRFNWVAYFIDVKLIRGRIIRVSYLCILQENSFDFDVRLQNKLNYLDLVI